MYLWRKDQNRRQRYILGSGGAVAATAPVEKAPAEEVPAVETPGTDTVAVPVEIPVILHGNGGLPETSELTATAEGFDLEGLAEPTRLGKLFDGWYLHMPGAPFHLPKWRKEQPGWICMRDGRNFRDTGVMMPDM